MLHTLLIKTAVIAAIGSMGLAAAAFTPGHAPAESLAAVQSKFSIKGVCVDPEGEAADKIPVFLQTLAVTGMGGGGGGGGEDGFNPGPTGGIDLAAQAGRKSRFKEVSKTLTGANGEFTLRNVEPGSYRVALGDMERTAWEIKDGVVMTDKDIDLGEIKLRPREGRGNTEGGGNGGNQGGGGGR